MKKELIIISGLFFILISLGFASAETCYVTTYANCIGNNHNVAMRLSASTNAHGEFSTGAYASVVCCDFGNGSTSCTGDNAIIRLSSTGNAHLEAPELVTNYYTQLACYDSLIRCRDTISNCDVNEIGVLYLSDLTNAHASASGYSTRICCQVVPPYEDCVLTSARWGNDTVIEGDGVYLILEGVNCSGANIDFEIYNESNAFMTSFTGTYAEELWIAQRFGGEYDYNNRIYLFNATVVGLGESQTQSGLLTVTPDIDCGMYLTCSDYDSGALCLSDPCLVAGISAPNPDLCACEWNITDCEDVCSVTDPDSGEGIGRCVYTNQVITNTCEEEPVGFLTFTWNASWIWDENCDAQCQIDNAYLVDGCRSGSKRIECPAQILLPFFNIYNLILTVLVIAMVYAVVGILKRKKIKIRFE